MELSAKRLRKAAGTVETSPKTLYGEDHPGREAEILRMESGPRCIGENIRMENPEYIGGSQT